MANKLQRKKKKWRMGNLAKVSHSSPSGISAKIVAMLVYLKENPGREPEVGQQEQKHPFEFIFGKINHHSIYFKCGFSLSFLLFPHFCSFINVSCGGFFCIPFSVVCISLDISPSSFLLGQNTKRLALKFQF